MHVTPLEVAAAIATQVAGALATARWLYHRAAPQPTDDLFGWNWGDIASSLVVGLFWLPAAACLLIFGAVAWSPKKKGN